MDRSEAKTGCPSRTRHVPQSDIIYLSNYKPASYPVEPLDSSENGPTCPYQADLPVRRDAASAAPVSVTTVLRRLRASHVSPHLGKCTWPSGVHAPLSRDSPFAASELAILPGFGPISTSNDHIPIMPVFERQICPLSAYQSAAVGVCALHGAAPTSPWLGSSCYLPYRDAHPRRTNGGGTPNR